MQNDHNPCLSLSSRTASPAGFAMCVASHLIDHEVPERELLKQSTPCASLSSPCGAARQLRKLTAPCALDFNALHAALMRGETRRARPGCGAERGERYATLDRSHSSGFHHCRPKNSASHMCLSPSIVHDAQSTDVETQLHSESLSAPSP